MSLAVVNQINVIHEAMNGSKNLTINLRFALKMLILQREHIQIVHYWTFQFTVIFLLFLYFVILLFYFTLKFNSMVH